MKKKIIKILFFYHSTIFLLSKLFVHHANCSSMQVPPALINPNSLTSTEIVNIDSYLNTKPDLNDKENIFSNLIIEHSIWNDKNTKNNPLAPQSSIRQNTELEPVVSQSNQQEKIPENAPAWEKNLIKSIDPNEQNQKEQEGNNRTSASSKSSKDITEDTLIKPRAGNQKPRILEGGIVETTPIQYRSTKNQFYFVKISIQENPNLKKSFSNNLNSSIRYISQTNTIPTTSTANTAPNTSSEQPQGEVVITTSGKKYFVPFSNNSSNNTPPPSGTVTPGTADNQYVLNNPIPQTTKDYAPRSFSEQAKEKGLNFPDTQLVNPNSPSYKSQNTPPPQSPLPEGLKLSKSLEKSNFALDEEQILRMQSQIKFENLRIESTLLAMEKEELQRKLAEQLVKQLQAQKQSEKQKSIQINELRDLIKEVMSEQGSSEGKPKTSKFSISNFNLKSKDGVKKAAKECSGKSKEECASRSTMCTYKKFKIKGKKKESCRIKCSLIPKKICKNIKVCTTNSKGRCINKK